MQSRACHVVCSSLRANDIVSVSANGPSWAAVVTPVAADHADQTDDSPTIRPHHLSFTLTVSTRNTFYPRISQTVSNTGFHKFPDRSK